MKIFRHAVISADVALNMRTDFSARIFLKDRRSGDIFPKKTLNNTASDFAKVVMMK